MAICNIAPITLSASLMLHAFTPIQIQSNNVVLTILNNEYKCESTENSSDFLAYTYDVGFQNVKPYYYMGNESMKLNKNIEKLNSFCDPNFDWGSSGMSIFPVAFIEDVKKIISELYLQPQIYPTGNDSIQLEYYDEENKKKYLEIEIFQDQVQLFIIDVDGREIEKTINKDVNLINKVVSDFYGQYYKA